MTCAFQVTRCAVAIHVWVSNAWGVYESVRNLNSIFALRVATYTMKNHASGYRDAYPHQHPIRNLSNKGDEARPPRPAHYPNINMNNKVTLS